uniref:Uncharacterized protein n=1 Tax=Amphora coffeiformis TaxID=265554 RepID=A0A7S3P7F3_9STRA|mmetsp:Transcript_19262/g.36414  ORF Transcript_19262/g.36414 Transcript_19262/m.36414 type:complete len:203 (+) Transcript_19262:154-762(+)|eukprot:scaffold2192_cov170-Amphora_coffeaeformis.AAC.17
MMRLLSFLSLFAAATAWTTGSAVSSFGGSVLISSASNGATLEMKKGKPNVPPQMRGQYKKQQEMAQMREQMVAASKPGQDGLPVFNLFVRTKLANVWYPCGSFKGDDRSAALAKSWADGGLLAGISKKQLDSGIAGSLYRDLPKLKETVVRAYPQLKKNKDSFEFGYKLGYEGLSKEQSSTVFTVEPKEQKGVLDGIKTIFS